MPYILTDHNETPSNETLSNETASNETPSNETPSNETPSSSLEEQDERQEATTFSTIETAALSIAAVSSVLVVCIGVSVAVSSFTKMKESNFVYLRRRRRIVSPEYLDIGERLRNSQRV